MGSSIAIVQQFVRSRAIGYLTLFQLQPSVQWFIYLEQGSIVYITYSIKPEEKFERHLRFLSRKIPQLTSAVRTQARSLLSQNPHQNRCYREYQVLRWLAQQPYFSANHMVALVRQLTQEALELLFLGENLKYNFQEDKKSAITDPFARFSPSDLLKRVEERLADWQTLFPEITSPYQRPYLSEEISVNDELSEKIREKFGRVLLGLSFRQLAARLYQDELALARKIHPFIGRGLIHLNEPEFPFDQFPLFTLHPCSNTSSASQKRPPTIVCVDDSPTVLKTINHFLQAHHVQVHTITESPKALMEIIRLKPDLILLDVGMPDLDGYKLCSLVKKYSVLSQTPIIMVTGKTGLIDRAKAKISGATDYLTKPFNQEQLIQMITKYLE